MAVSPNEFYTPKILDAQLTGMIKTKEPGIYSARLRIPSGVVTSDVLEGLARLARKYGRGELYLTARLGFEMPGIPGEAFPALREELGGIGVPLAGCGPRMRSTVTCKGTVCPHGNLDSFALAWEIDRRHNDASVLPHKFKAAVAGCASSCSKPQVNDVGLVGVSEPELDPAACIRCGLCKEACHLSAIRLEEGLPVFQRERCVACGDCVKACPARAMKEARHGVDLYAGGRWGREKQVALKLASFLDEEEALGAIGRVKSWYAENGGKKERLGQTILRLGARNFQRHVLEGVDPAKWVEITAEAEARFQPSR
ncbi:MAG: 4Fe-4S binding protein [Deltaproteobacteria bacterium]|nr:4Fe-4S binding protein [Deltaproteobacteria bacterium]